MRVAALDLGSNTFLMLIAEVENGKIEKVILDECRVTRLGQGVHANRKFHPDALARAELCLAEFAGLIRSKSAAKVIAVATSAARDVADGDKLLEMGRKLGIPIQIISGAQEAEITYDGATADFDEMKSAAVIDVGGGSTEVIGKSASGDLKGISFDMGSVRLTEMFLPRHPCTAGDLAQLDAYIRETLAAQAEQLEGVGPEVIAVAGTPTTLAAVDLAKPFDERQVHKYRFTTQGLWEWREKLAALSVEQRQALVGMQPNRADVLVAGVSILALTAEQLKAKSIVVSTKGVRYGVARAWQKLIN